MRDGINPLTGERQPFYFPDDHPSYPGWFKGMECIIREHSLWPEAGLPAECAGPKRPASEGQASCCCRHLLYTQHDFTSQKPLLQEHIESRGHLCDYYPKYHCELNFIEQYWGAAKLRFCVAGRARTLEEMERKMLGCLDDIPLEQIQRYIPTLYFFRTKNCLQICKQVRLVHFRLPSRIVRCTSSMGQQKVPRPSRSPPRYGRTGEGNGSKVTSLASYMYIRRVLRCSPIYLTFEYQPLDFCPFHVT